MFCASWVLGPAAGPTGDSTFSPKMGRAWPPSLARRDSPKMVPWVFFSVRIQSMSWSNGMGRMMSLIAIPLQKRISVGT